MKIHFTDLFIDIVLKHSGTDHLKHSADQKVNINTAFYVMTPRQNFGRSKPLQNKTAKGFVSLVPGL